MTAPLNIAPLNIVWFKRDLRIADHRPLSAAAGRGNVLPLYIAEPEYWAQQDVSARQWAFAAESLYELQSALTALGQPLCVITGHAVGITVPVWDYGARDYGVQGLRCQFTKYTN
jgi:deoxyribodipyrimidine photo-lyase